MNPDNSAAYDAQALVIAIVFTAAAIPSPFLPNQPPTPPSNVAALRTLGLGASVKSLFTNPVFYLQFIGFVVFAGAIDALTTIVNQGLEPYGFPQVDAGYAVAFLIFVGVFVALIISPILDRTKAHLITLKVLVVILASSYTVLPFIPETHSTAGLYVVFAFIGASSLSVEPCVLEFQAATTHPVSPEYSSVICWSGAKIMTALFTYVAGNALMLKRPEEGQPKGSLFNGFIFLAASLWITVSTLFSGIQTGTLANLFN